MRRPLVVVLLAGAALLLVDGIAFGLREAQETSDHGEVLPERSVLWRRILFPAQQLTEPALDKTFERKEGEKGYKSVRIECTAIWTQSVISKMFKHSCSPKKAKQTTRLRNLKTELLLSEASKYCEEEKATVTPFQKNEHIFSLK